MQVLFTRADLAPLLERCGSNSKSPKAATKILKSGKPTSGRPCLMVQLRALVRKSRVVRFGPPGPGRLEGKLTGW
jgi:hypothetical protein